VNLLVDVGNSRIKWVEQHADQLSDAHGDSYNKSDLAGTLDRLWGGLEKPAQIRISNVAGEIIEKELRQWTQERWSTQPHFARVTQSARGVMNGYADITRLGVDRWLSLIAAWSEYHQAACIVDCGTAVTIDGLNNKGRHLGGLILPGIALMQHSLRIAPAIPEIKTAAVAGKLADNTGDAVAEGCVLAVVSLIDRIVRDMQRGSRKKLICIITGGDAHRVRDLLAGDFVFRPLLVLEGLALLGGDIS
jgi:type III pantothenate kinase